MSPEQAAELLTQVQALRDLLQVGIGVILAVIVATTWRSL